MDSFLTIVGVAKGSGLSRDRNCEVAKGAGLNLRVVT